MKTSPTHIFIECLANLVLWCFIAFIAWSIYSFFSPTPPKVSPKTDENVCRTLLREMRNTKTQGEVNSVKSKAINAKCSEIVINYRDKFPLDRYP